MLTLKKAMWQNRRCLRHGAFNRKILGRTLSSPFRNFSSKKGTCPSKPKPPACPQPEPTKCEPPSQQSLGREKGQQEFIPCVPDCRKGKPNLGIRGCLPWEKGVEICPEKEKPRRLETQCCEHLCEPYVGQGIIDKLQMSTCEYRRFKKCVEKLKDPKKCMDFELPTVLSKKIYPMTHAVNKKYLPGCPINSNRFVMPQKNHDCDT